MTKERIKGHICVLTANTIFGVFIPVSKYLMGGHISPMTLTMFRVLGAAMLFWTASLFVEKQKTDIKTLAWFFFFALTGVVLNQGLFIFALGHTHRRLCNINCNSVCGFVYFGILFKRPRNGAQAFGHWHWRNRRGLAYHYGGRQGFGQLKLGFWRFNRAIYYNVRCNLFCNV